MPKTYPAWQKVNNLINLIWDIDGTLLNTKGLGAGPFCDAFTHHTGKGAIIDKKKLSGFTDYEIALSLMRDAGIQENFFLAEKILKSFSTRLEKVLAINPPRRARRYREDARIHTEVVKIYKCHWNWKFSRGSACKTQGSWDIQVFPEE